MTNSMSIIHPKTSYTQVQSPLPEISFLTLTEYFVLPGKIGKNRYRYRNMTSKTSWCWFVTPCTAVIT